jgi:Cytochrome c oxidase subunit IV
VSRLPFADQPQETRFFLLIAGWAGVLGVVYWFVSYEVAGTVLLAGLALATGALSVWLLRSQRRRRQRAETRASEADDRPFLDEEGRLPAPTLAPFAVGLGVALAALGPVFGVAPVAVGAVSFLWGAGTWLRAGREEFDAQKRDR